MANDRIATSEKVSLSGLIVSQFESMPRQLQVAARFVLDHPKEAALSSVREQARRAGVSHTTMVRLAMWLGLENFEELRSLCLEALQGSDVNVATVSPQPARQPARRGHHSTIVNTATRLASHLEALKAPAEIGQLSAAADVLASACSVLCVGLRAEQVVAQRFAYLRALLGRPTTLLESSGTPGAEVLHTAGPNDVMLAIAMEPYSRATMDLAQLANRQGVAIVSITDSKLSPLSIIATKTVLVPPTSRFPIPSVVPALIAAEFLAVMIAERQGNVSDLLRNAEAYLTTSGAFWNAGSRIRQTEVSVAPRNGATMEPDHRKLESRQIR